MPSIEESNLLPVSLPARPEATSSKLKQASQFCSWVIVDRALEAKRLWAAVRRLVTGEHDNKERRTNTAFPVSAREDRCRPSRCRSRQWFIECSVEDEIYSSHRTDPLAGRILTTAPSDVSTLPPTGDSTHYNNTEARRCFFTVEIKAESRIMHGQTMVRGPCAAHNTLILASWT